MASEAAAMPRPGSTVDHITSQRSFSVSTLEFGSDSSGKSRLLKKDRSVPVSALT